MMGSPHPQAGSPEIAFFDVETTVPSRPGQGYTLLEFGVILVCPRRLAEVACYSTLVRPADPSAISPASVRCNGITKELVATAPAFAEVADRIYALLHGRVWAGHNILRFDCARIREAFVDIGRPAPEPRGTIDSLPLLTQKFGRRAGDMKMASLACYFGLGQQKHRSLDDVRMNLEVMKYCATVLFLESNLVEVSTTNSRAPPDVTSQIVSSGFSVDGTGTKLNSASDLSLDSLEKKSHVDRNRRLEIHNLHEIGFMQDTDTGPSDLVPLIDQMKIDPSETNDPTGTGAMSEVCSGHAGFLEPVDVSMPCISTSISPYSRGRCRIQLLHRDAPLQLCCMGQRVHFGVSSKFLDVAGRPKLSIVVDAPPSLCQVLDLCDNLAQRSSLESGSSSEWRPVLKKNDFSNVTTIRLHIPTVQCGDVGSYLTEMYQKEPSGSIRKLVFSEFDVSELDLLFAPGTSIDAFFCADVYDYQQHAGIRLVAKKLIVHRRWV